MPQKIKSIVTALASPKIFFYALIWLMVLLVVGTVSQKYIGLYLAGEVYFSSFIVWLGGAVPVPGGYSVMSLIGVNLLCRTIQERWEWPKAGTIIVHLGALLLLLGGFITAAFSVEGNMVIPEGGTANFISSYHDRELAVIEITDEKAEEVATYGPAFLKQGAQPGYGITVKGFFRNSAIAMQDGEPRIVPARRAVDDEDNVSALLFTVVGKDYSVFEFMPRPPVIEYEGRNYMLMLRRTRTALPFEIDLVKFTKETHPGTDTARLYSSEVILKDGAQEWRSVISMNKPLRYKGYTFFQSSFLTDESGSVATVLAVVKNAGRLYPYIASIVICIGLLVHMIIMIPKLTGGRVKP